jgi:uncharacterized protein
MDERVEVRYRKYDGALHWNFPAYRLGADEHGEWLGCPAGTVLHRGTDHAVTWEVAQVLLVPAGGRWWTANFNAAPHRTEIYCDMTSVPEWHDGVLGAIDLDLDVARRRDGAVKILDEDEFAEHQVRYGYPPDVVAAARDAADTVYAAVRANAEPFATVYHRWLSQVPA